MIVVDLTSLSSFDEATFWYNEMMRDRPRTPIVLCGTKSDLSESIKVTAEQIEFLAKTWDVPFFIVSSKTGKDVDDLFLRCSELLRETN